MWISWVFGSCLMLTLVHDKLRLSMIDVMLEMFYLTTSVYIFLFEVKSLGLLLITELIKSCR